MLDIHSHILYGVDDGAKTLEESLDMLKEAVNGGTKAIVATPHYRRGHYEVPYEEHLSKINELKLKARENKLNIEIFLGQEVLIDNKIIELLEENKIGTINNTSYMLVETDFLEYDSQILDYIYELKIRGINPILAHPERYKYIQEDPSILNDFKEEGCLFQINGGSIKGSFGKTVEKTAINLIQHGFCNFLGSDTHGLSYRTPNLKEAIEKLKDIDKEIYNKILENNSKMLNNEVIEADIENFTKKKSFFSFFKRK